MPTFPVRRLGAAGIISDMNPSDIEDPAVFTAGVNVRFRNGKVSRGPVFRTISTLDFEPIHCVTIPPSSAGYDQVVLVSAKFDKIARLNGNMFEDLTPEHWVSVTESAVTSCFLGGVSYLNSETNPPVYLGPSDSRYQAIPDWPSDYRCRVMRAYKDTLVALGVSKNGQLYPTMVKWSDLAGFGAPPGSWDPTSTTNSAGENIVNEMQHAIVDGLALRNSFILYCTNSVWQMDYIGGDFIYDFTKLFDERGIMGPNCAVQVGSQHFVFDRNDIYVHDGVQPRSIVDLRNREFIFNSLDTSRANLCFVSHDARLSEIRFCYPSSDGLVGFGNPVNGCNRAAVYNYANDTWTFDDLPNVVSACRSSLVSGESWESSPTVTWDTAEGIFSTTEGDQSQHVLFASRSAPHMGISQSRLYGCDLVTGGLLTIPIEGETLKPALVQRTGLDLDIIGKNLTQYTNLQCIWPQVAIEAPEDAYWQFGANDLVNVEPSWSEEMTFDPRSEGKIDINEAGKYLAYRFGCRGSGDFQLSGFDIQLIVRGRR